MKSWAEIKPIMYKISVRTVSVGYWPGVVDHSQNYDRTSHVGTTVILFHKHWDIHN